MWVSPNSGKFIYSWNLTIILFRMNMENTKHTHKFMEKLSDRLLYTHNHMTGRREWTWFRNLQHIWTKRIFWNRFIELYHYVFHLLLFIIHFLDYYSLDGTALWHSWLLIFSHLKITLCHSSVHSESQKRDLLKWWGQHYPDTKAIERQ